MQGQKIIFFLIVFPSPLLRPSEAPCPTPAQSRAAFAESRALTSTFGSTFQMRTQSFTSADAHGQTSLATPFSKHKNPLVLFSAPLKPKMQTEEEAQNSGEHGPAPHPCYREGANCYPHQLPERAADLNQAGRVQSTLENYAATFFFLFKVRCFWSRPVTLAKSQF